MAKIRRTCVINLSDAHTPANISPSKLTIEVFIEDENPVNGIIRIHPPILRDMVPFLLILVAIDNYYIPYKLEFPMAGICAS